MGVSIDLRIEGLGAVQQVLEQLSGKQQKEAYAKALNDVGFAVRKNMRAEFGRVFDRVTPYINNSVFVTQATAERLKVRIAPEYQQSRGVDPQKILQAQEFGGRRADKRSEVALRAAGILPAGYQTAIPVTPYPGSDDGRGNLRGAFVRQVIGYLRSAPDGGMTERRRRGIQRGTSRAAGRRYFVSRGAPSRLAPGVWAATDAGVKPVLMFTRAGTYQPRINMQRIAGSVGMQEVFERKLRYRIRQVAGQ